MAQFVGVTCKSCGRDFDIAEVKETGLKPPPWDDPHHIQQKRCPFPSCQKRNHYSSDDLLAEPLYGPDTDGPTFYRRQGGRER
jgi:hypothetical protein